MVATEHASHFYNPEEVSVKIYSDKDEWEAGRLIPPEFHVHQECIIQLNVFSCVMSFQEVKWKLPVCEVITVLRLKVWLCDWKWCGKLSRIIFQKKRDEEVSLSLVACLTCIFCCSCGPRGQTPCYTSSWGVGQTCFLLPHSMLTLLERLLMVFVTTCW